MTSQDYFDMKVVRRNVTTVLFHVCLIFSFHLSQ